jgi:hypothetical protein
MIDLDKIDLDKIEQDAAHAAYGRWEPSQEHGTYSNWHVLAVEVGAGVRVASCGVLEGNARHIANCDPQTVLALVRAVKASQDYRANRLRWEAGRDQFHTYRDSADNAESIALVEAGLNAMDASDEAYDDFAAALDNLLAPFRNGGDS